MRHPLSIHVRSARRRGRRFAARVARKLMKMAGRAPAPPPRAARPRIELADFAAALDALGALGADGSTPVLVHSGIGHAGRWATPVSALLAFLRERFDTLLFPALPFNTLMASYLASEPTFHARTSPTKMGILAETALADPDRMRSVHPTHSVCGFGPGAAALLSDHHLGATPFDASSPYARLVAAGGRILTIGVGLNSVTGFHEIEDALGDDFPVRVYLDRRWRIACTDDAGRNLVVETPCHDPYLSAVRDCDLLEADLRAAGAWRTAKLGNALVGWMDAARMHACVAEAARRKRTIYGRVWG